MKKILSLAFIAAVFLLNCSADGFFTQQGNDPNTGEPIIIIEWGRVCKVNDDCFSVDTKEDCDNKDGAIVARSECSEVKEL